MAIYTNIGGTSKQIYSICTNNNNASKGFINVYSNISGTQKEIFTGTKKFWFKAYPVNKYNVYVGTDITLDDDGVSASSTNGYNANSSYILYKDATSPDNICSFALSNSVKVYCNSGSDGKHLDSQYNNYYYTLYGNDVIFQVDSSGTYYNDSDDKSFSWHCFYYKLPVSHSSSYTLISIQGNEELTQYPESYIKSYTPCYSNGKWFMYYGQKKMTGIQKYNSHNGDGVPYIGHPNATEYYARPTIETNVSSFYSINENTDNTGDPYSYYSDGYYYEYLGFYV